jgi:hypothetical protein
LFVVIEKVKPRIHSVSRVNINNEKFIDATPAAPPPTTTTGESRALSA